MEFRTNDEEEEEKEPGEDTGIADDLLDEIDDDFGDDAMGAETLVPAEKEEDAEDEEKVDFDRHDDVDKI